jgi:hypothetical protein
MSGQRTLRHFKSWWTHDRNPHLFNAIAPSMGEATVLGVGGHVCEEMPGFSEHVLFDNNPGVRTRDVLRIIRLTAPFGRRRSPGAVQRNWPQLIEYFRQHAGYVWH